MRIWCFILFTFLIQPCFGQTNLVPNPSFEDYTACPSFASQLDRAAPWFNPNIGTPEYYNACATAASYMSLPSGTTGHYQYPRTGNGFAGIWVFRTDVNNMREYVEVGLLSELEAGKCYYLEFYVNAPNDFPYASDGIGAHVSIGAVTAGNANPLSVSPQVENQSGNLITDTLTWTKVSGYFTAIGGENHITIGNFKNDSSTNWVDFNPGVWYQYGSYLYVDDVSLVEMELEIELGVDTILCAGESILLETELEDAVYNWENGSTFPTRIIDSEGEYWVEVSLDECKVSDTIDVGVLPVPQLSLGDDISHCDEVAMVLTVNSNLENPIWQDGSTGLDFLTSGEGSYWATVSNECGTASDTLKIEVKECNCYVYIPNAFSPDNNGINDSFGIEYDCSFSFFEFRIFDRWGKMIYQSSNPDFRWEPKHQSLDVFTYQLRYSSNEVNTGKGEKIGKIHVIR